VLVFARSRIAHTHRRSRRPTRLGDATIADWRPRPKTNATCATLDGHCGRFSVGPNKWVESSAARSASGSPHAGRRRASRWVRPPAAIRREACLGRRSASFRLREGRLLPPACRPDVRRMPTTTPDIQPCTGPLAPVRRARRAGDHRLWGSSRVVCDISMNPCRCSRSIRSDIARPGLHVDHTFPAPKRRSAARATTRDRGSSP